MIKKLAIFFLVAIFLIPAAAWAQSPSKPGSTSEPGPTTPGTTTGPAPLPGPGQPSTGSGAMAGAGMMTPDFKDRVSKITQMMDNVNQMLQQGNLTPSQQGDLMNLMNQMGMMLQQTCAPMGTGADVAQQQSQKLEDLQQRLDNIKSQTNK